MENLLRNTKKLIYKRQHDILSSALILSIMIIISRVFGLIRYRTFATFFTKEELDIFFAAFRLPDLVFEILITGALSSAFIPIYIKYKKDPKELYTNISSIINLVFLSLAVIIVIIVIFADPIVRIMTPGFTDAQVEYVVYLSRILIVGQLPFLVMGNMLSGISQANQTFMISAIAPIVYNIGIIGGTIILAPYLWLFGPVIGVVFGAFLFFIVQVPTMYILRFNYRPFTFNKKVLHEFITLFVPRTLSVITTQIDLTIDLTLSTLLGSGSYTIFYFAQHLQLFPVSFVGVAFGQASLPYISNLFKDGQIATIKKLFVDSILQLLYISIPLSLFFIFARTPIVRIIFGGRKFDWIGTNSTALTVSIFALSIPMHTIFYFITRSFYASHDTRTPFVINFMSVALNASLSYFFISYLKLGVWSLGLAFSIAVSINVIALITAFYFKIKGFDFTKLIVHTVKIYVTGFCASIAPYLLLKLMDDLLIDTARTINVLTLLTMTFLLFVLCYAFFSWLFNVEEIYMFRHIVRRFTSFKKQIEEVYSGTSS
jgi:putative peptidoglycan lipid II flippase